VFAAVTDEVGRVFSSEATLLSRYDADGAATVVGVWTRTGAPPPLAVGGRFPLGGRDLHTLVLQTGRPARIEDYSQASRVGVEMARKSGVRSGVGVPISVAGRLWGVIGVTSAQEHSLAADTEARLTGFTELVATALANAQARLELRRFAEEQAALRRVATLVAGGAAPGEVFAAVTTEVGRLLSVDFTSLSRYDADGTATVLGAWTRTGAAFPVPIGFQMGLGGRNLHTLVFETGRPARVDHYGRDAGLAPEMVLAAGVRSSVGAPILVDGRLWGVMSVGSTQESPLSPDTEARLAAFTELVATAIANAEAQAALAASRARIVAAADASRRRIERDLHDGVQQRLVILALQIRAVQATVPPAAPGLNAEVDSVAAEIDGVLDELREIASGLNPPALAEGGLRAALQALARRSAVPVRLDVRVDGRVADPIELAAYYVIAETLTNVAKHADASEAEVRVQSDDGLLRVVVRDDGRGGADITGGSGLVGLTDRVEALGGRFELHSAPGAGTAVQVVLPLSDSRPQAVEPAGSSPSGDRAAP
jgi:signal transduction histidine kinase